MIWPAGDVTNEITILHDALNMSSWKDFGSKGDSSNFETSPSFQICTSILDFKRCLPKNEKFIQQQSTMFTCRDGKGRKFSSQAQKCYIHCLAQLIWRYIRNCSTNQIAGNSLLSVEIMLTSPICSSITLVVMYSFQHLGQNLWLHSKPTNICRAKNIAHSCNITHTK